jgi:plasmid stabilization system protein ParE
MTFQVVISTQAAAELREAAEWWAENRDPEEAARWFVGFDAKLRGLGNNSFLYAVADENDSFPYELRQLNFGLSSRPTHRALFTVLVRRDGCLVPRRRLAQNRITPGDVDPPNRSG